MICICAWYALTHKMIHFMEPIIIQAGILLSLGESGGKLQWIDICILSVFFVERNRWQNLQ